MVAVTGVKRAAPVHSDRPSAACVTLANSLPKASHTASSELRVDGHFHSTTEHRGRGEYSCGPLWLSLASSIVCDLTEV